MGRLLALALVVGCTDPPDHIPIVLDKDQYVVGEEITFSVDDFCIPLIKTADCWENWIATGADGIVVQFDVGAAAVSPGQGTIEVTAHWRDDIGSADVTDTAAVLVVAP